MQIAIKLHFAALLLENTKKIMNISAIFLKY